MTLSLKWRRALTALFFVLAAAVLVYEIGYDNLMLERVDVAGSESQVEGVLDGAPGTAAALPIPTATPHWYQGILAVAVPDGKGMAVAVVSVGASESVAGGVQPGGTEGGSAWSSAESDDRFGWPTSSVRQAPLARLADGFQDVGRLAWSNDESRLAFAARRDNNWDVFVVDRDGSNLVRITDHVAYDAGPAWSPDDSQIAFESYRDGEYAVYRVASPAGASRPDGAPSGVAPDPESDAAVAPDPESDPAVAPDVESDAAVAPDPGSDAAVAPDVESRASGSRVANSPTRITASGESALEPAWSRDGEWIAYSTWIDGAYHLRARRLGDGMSVDVDAPVGSSGSPLPGPSDIDFRAASWSPGGDSLAYLRRQYGEGQLVLGAWDSSSGAIVTSPTTLAPGIIDYAWYPGGGAVAFLTDGRSSTTVEVREIEGFSRHRLAVLPEGARNIAWARGASAELPALVWSLDDDELVVAGSSNDPEGRHDLVNVNVSVSGARINSALAADYEALRAEVREAVGADFLGSLSDLWRPLHFDNDRSAFFSWHKTGRAFDTLMELRGPGGRRDMVLVREEYGGRTMWRMYLRAAAQDGSVGRPLQEPGWTFSAGGDRSLSAYGGERGSGVPSGYWLDFTGAAARYGWERIPSLTRSSQNWRTNWSAIEYWHYERREGLRWFEAVRQIYDDDHLITNLSPDVLRERGVSLRRFASLGFPRGWPREG